MIKRVTFKAKRIRSKLRRIPRKIKRVPRNILWQLFPTKTKEWYALGSWKRKKAVEGRLKNSHFKEFHTKHFEIEDSFYSGKRILDIGCGPRGSLEWADMALERIGLDPLAKQYLKLGADEHKTKYVAAYSESIPFDDDYFDVISSFNSLDHVADVQITISEIKRVLKPGGEFLLLTELNHKPKIREPQDFSWDIVHAFLPEFEILNEKHYEMKVKGMYESIRYGIPFNHSDRSKRTGILSAKFRKFGYLTFGK